MGEEPRGHHTPCTVQHIVRDLNCWENGLVRNLVSDLVSDQTGQ